jgi:hypothetical protein
MKFRITYTILFLTVQSLFAQVEFKTKISKNKLGLNQRLRVEFTINKQGGDNFTPPNFRGFDVVGGPSQSVNQSWINGQSTYSQSYTYIISPIKKGNLRIGPAKIEYEGKTLKSNMVTVAVVDPIELPKNPNDPDYIANQNVHLETLVSNENPFVGEGIYVEYRLYFSHNVATVRRFLEPRHQTRPNQFEKREISRRRIPLFFNQKVCIDSAKIREFIFRTYQDRLDYRSTYR